MRTKLYIYFLALTVIFTLQQCRKNQHLTGSQYQIETSSDTILFDTIFTTIGSTTKQFKCYNNYNGILTISSIHLEQETNSPFRINVDGVSGVHFENIELLPGDSAYIFVEVTIDPNGQNLPLIVEDRILFNTNGNEYQVILNAWGQDAYFHVNELVEGQWLNDKPHVIYGIAAVGYPNLDSGKTLVIQEGTQIHGHANAALLVYKSALEVNGTLNNPVLFQQDRMEDYLLYPADSVSGQWRGIYFLQPLQSHITHSEIKNAVIGIQVDTLSNNESVFLNKVKVNNSLYANILTQCGNVNAVNCLFGNSNNYSAYVSIGGNVQFEHCTFANYWSGFRNTPSLVFKDYYKSTNDDIIFRPFSSAIFSNCVVDGNGSNEIICDTLDRIDTGIDPNFIFDYCSIKTEDTLSNSTFFTNCFQNLNTYFVNPQEWNFELTDSSNLIDLGNVNSTVTEDILERSRNIPNDIGCYEYF